MASAGTTSSGRGPELDPTVGPLSQWITDWGTIVIDGLTTVGDMALFAWQMCVWMFTRLPRKERCCRTFIRSAC